jgi:hypothetical protein
MQQISKGIGYVMVVGALQLVLGSATGGGAMPRPQQCLSHHPGGGP